MTERSRTVQPLPELTGENVESLMRERIAATKTEKTVVPMLWQGLLEMKIPTGKEERSAILYVPREIPQGSPFVFLNVPEGEETVNFLIESGWMDAADRYSFCLFAAQPVNGHWGSAADEAEYLKTCYREEQTGRYFLPQLSAYVVGYGEIGAELQKVVMEEPIFVAAAAFLDASALDPVWLSKHKEGNFHFGTETIDIPFAEVPVPVWICSRERNAETEAAARFWIDASRAKENGEDPDYGNIYLQAADSMFTPEGHILKVAVRQEALVQKPGDDRAHLELRAPILPLWPRHSLQYDQPQGGLRGNGRRLPPLHRPKRDRAGIPRLRPRKLRREESAACADPPRGEPDHAQYVRKRPLVRDRGAGGLRGCLGGVRPRADADAAERGSGHGAQASVA